MTLADDLRAAAQTTPPSPSRRPSPAVPADPERLARAALAVAAPFLVDAERVEQALAAREPVDRAEQRVAPLPSLLWTRSGKDEARFLGLMEQHGWLKLATIRADGGQVTG
jgi:hypothetical protein